jgi:hypothetical protein
VEAEPGHFPVGAKDHRDELGARRLEMLSTVCVMSREFEAWPHSGEISF